MKIYIKNLWSTTKEQLKKQPCDQLLSPDIWIYLHKVLEWAHSSAQAGYPTRDSEGAPKPALPRGAFWDPTPTRGWGPHWTHTLILTPQDSRWGAHIADRIKTAFFFHQPFVHDYKQAITMDLLHRLLYVALRKEVTFIPRSYCISFQES